MLRLLPQDVLERTLDKPEFREFLAQELGTMLHDLQTALRG
jgi:hypothetical protein